MSEKTKLNFSVDVIKYDNLEKINPKNLLSFMSLSKKPFVILPDGVVYGSAGRPPVAHPFEFLDSGSDDFLQFNNPIAAKFAQENDGLYVPRRKDHEEVVLNLAQYIEGVKRLSKKLPDGKLKQIASQPDFMKDLEAELRYLSNVEPDINKGSGKTFEDYTRAYGVTGKIVDFDEKYHPEKRFGHEKNEYTINLELLLEFFGEGHFNVSARFLRADIAVNPLIKSASLNEYGLECLRKLIEENKEFCDWKKIRTSIEAELVKKEYKYVTLTMCSPRPSSGNDAPLATEELLAKFVPLADKLSAGFVKMDEQVQAKMQLDYKEILGF